MERKKTDITLLAAPFGFGPLGKALAIAHEFVRRNYTVKILGDTSAQRIIKASGFHAEHYTYREPLDLAKLNTRLAISCLDISTPIIKSGVPLVFVDSLFWLRGRWEKALSPDYNADLFLAQNFFLEAPEETKRAVAARLHMVDAVLPPSSLDLPPKSSSPQLIVLYPGGMGSPYLDLKYQENYLHWAIELVETTLNTVKVDLSNFVTIVPPQLLNSSITSKIDQIGGRYESGIGIKKVGDLIAQSRAIIATPGIEFILEAYSAGKIPYFLPAYNGTQVLQSIGYRKAHIGSELCPAYAKNLEKIAATTTSLGQLSVLIENENLEKLRRPKHKEEAVKNLVASFQNPLSTTERYPLGNQGATQVVNLSLELLK